MSLFHERLRQLKDECGETQAKIAEDLGITPQALSYYINGREPNYDLLIKIANYFNVSLEYLLGISDNKSLNNTNIGKELGLSDEAIKTIKMARKSLSSIRIFNPDILIKMSSYDEENSKDFKIPYQYDISIFINYFFESKFFNQCLYYLMDFTSQRILFGSSENSNIVQNNLDEKIQFMQWKFQKSLINMLNHIVITEIIPRIYLFEMLDIEHAKKIAENRDIVLKSIEPIHEKIKLLTDEVQNSLNNISKKDFQDELQFHNREIRDGQITGMEIYNWLLSIKNDGYKI